MNILKRKKRKILKKNKFIYFLDEMSVNHISKDCNTLNNI